MMPFHSVCGQTNWTICNENRARCMHMRLPCAHLGCCVKNAVATRIRTHAARIELPSWRQWRWRRDKSILGIIAGGRELHPGTKLTKSESCNLHQLFIIIRIFIDQQLMSGCWAKRERISGLIHGAPKRTFVVCNDMNCWNCHIMSCWIHIPLDHTHTHAHTPCQCARIPRK